MSIAATLAFGCGGHDEVSNRAPGLDFSAMGGAHGFATGEPCSKPEEGCPCDEPGAIESCGSVYRQDDGYLSCTIGEIICGEEEEWGKCIGDEISLNPIPGTP